MHSSLKREVGYSTLKSVESDSVGNGLSPLQHFLKKTVLLEYNNVGMGPTNLFHALAYYSKYNERFDLLFMFNSDTLSDYTNTVVKFAMFNFILLNTTNSRKQQNTN